jgi:hypothetical protein
VATPLAVEPEYEQVGGIRVDGDVSGDAFEHVAFGVRRDFDRRESLPAVDCGARVGKRAGANRNAQCSTRIQRFDNPATELAQVIVDDRDGKFAKDLVEIGLRIINAVDYRSQK